MVEKELLKLVTETKGFAVEQAPEIIQQILGYSYRMASITAPIYFALTIIIAGLIPFVLTRKNRRNYGWDEDTWVPFCFGLLISIIPGVLFADSLLTILQINTAPKMFVIEYLSKLI